ncbi:unnamed protein product, partial [Effrenium voratum]
MLSARSSLEREHDMHGASAGGCMMCDRNMWHHLLGTNYQSNRRPSSCTPMNAAKCDGDG